jgi:hypothetical protein
MHRGGELSPVGVAKILLTLAVVVAFCLAHVGLHARLFRLRRDISALQSAQGDLLSQANALRLANEAMKTPKSVQEHARDALGMIAYDATRHESMVTPDETRARYALARAVSDRTTAQAGDDADKAGRLLTLMGEQIGWIGPAGNAVAATAPIVSASSSRKAK